jgi:hypothetical protein
MDSRLNVPALAVFRSAETLNGIAAHALMPVHDFDVIDPPARRTPDQELG